MPQIEDPYDVIIRIAYVGVCGSDVCKLLFDIRKDPLLWKFMLKDRNRFTFGFMAASRISSPKRDPLSWVTRPRASSTPWDQP